MDTDDTFEASIVITISALEDETPEARKKRIRLWMGNGTSTKYDDGYLLVLVPLEGCEPPMRTGDRFWAAKLDAGFQKYPNDTDKIWKWFSSTWDTNRYETGTQARTSTESSSPKSR